MQLFDVIHENDVDEVALKFEKHGNDEADFFDREFRVVSRKTSDVFWMLIRLVPAYDSQGKLKGWDGFGLDITSHVEVQHGLKKKQQSIKSLYDVSLSISGVLEIDRITERGLRAICLSTKAQGALCYLQLPNNSGSPKLQASYGVTEKDRERFDQLPYEMTPLKSAVSQGEPCVVDDLSRTGDSYWNKLSFSGFRSAVVVPMGVKGGEIIGAIVILQDQIASFDDESLTLIHLAAIQISMAVKQADTFTAYRQQTRRLESLYRTSHELSTNISIDDVVNKSLQIISEELKIDRLWLGLLGELGNRIIAQASHSKSISYKLAEVNALLSGQGSALTKVVEEKQALVLENPASLFTDLQLRRVSDILNGEKALFVPIVVRGVVLGVLAAQMEDG